MQECKTEENGSGICSKYMQHIYRQLLLRPHQIHLMVFLDFY